MSVSRTARRRQWRGPALAGGWLIVLVAGAQETPPAESAAPTAAPAAAPVVPLADPERAKAELEAAYRREFAFLAAQQAELEQQLQRLKTQAGDEERAGENKLAALQNRLLATQNEARRLEKALAEAERGIADLEDQRGILDASYQQAIASLQLQGIADVGDETFAAGDDLAKIATLFNAAAGLIEQGGTRRETAGRFYLADGREVAGEIVEIGRIAAYGVSPAGAGVLAPAGEGRLKLWPGDSAEAARAVAEGRAPDALPIFIYESLLKPVEEKTAKSLLRTLDDGGAIAWIIAVLGLVALVLIVLRVIFLRGAGADTAKLLAETGEWVRQGRMAEALEACRRRAGATSRVIAAAIRNLDRERAHLEDIVSEAILHESSHLNRFGAIIIVIAAVSPLLGLLGTVTGMIATFDVITEFGTGDPKLLSGGISVALITTEVGLAVAIPALLFGNLLAGWAERIKDDMEKAALRIVNLDQERRLGAA